MKTLEAEDLSSTTKAKKGNAFLQWWLENFRAIGAEFMATAMLLFFGCLGCLSAYGSGNENRAVLGFAFTVLFLVYTFAKISGAHFNPAITFLAVLLKNMSIPLGLAYVVAQCAGAIMGSYLVYLITPPDIPLRICLTVPFQDYSVEKSIVIEALLTWILGYLCCMAWDPKALNQPNVAVQFGLAVGGLAMIGGPLTGGSMNPARSLGPAVIAGDWRMHYVYWVGPIIGTIMAAVTYKILNWFNDFNPKKPEFTIGDEVA